MLPYPSLLLFRYPMAQKNPKRDRKTIIKVAVTSAPFICAPGVEDKDKSLVGQQNKIFGSRRWETSSPARRDGYGATSLERGGGGLVLQTPPRALPAPGSVSLS